MSKLLEAWFLNALPLVPESAGCFLQSRCMPVIASVTFTDNLATQSPEFQHEDSQYQKLSLFQPIPPFCRGDYQWSVPNALVSATQLDQLEDFDVTFELSTQQLESVFDSMQHAPLAKYHLSLPEFWNNIHQKSVGTHDSSDVSHLLAWDNLLSASSWWIWWVDKATVTPMTR